MPLGPGGLDEPRQHGRRPPGAEAGDEREPARLPLRIQFGPYLSQILRLHGDAHLQADGVGDTADVFQMGAIQLPGARADPQEVGPQVGVRLVFGHPPGQGGLVGQVQGLVAGEELTGAQVLGQTAEPLHEVQGGPHLIERFEAVPCVPPAPWQIPVLGVVQIREATIHQGSRCGPDG